MPLMSGTEFLDEVISKSFVVSIFGWKQTEISHPPEYMLLGKILIEKK
jgi:hypothetical protein